MSQRESRSGLAVPAGATGSRGLVLTVAFAGFIATLDDYIVAVSLPAISHDLGATTSEVAQVTLVYLLAIVSTVLLFGRIGDRRGFRRVFVSGYVVFIVSSAVCALAPSIQVLVAARFVQGLGAAMLSVTGPALIARHVAPERRGWAFGILTTVTALGITLGAPLGGVLSGLLSWRFVFLVNVPIGLVAAVAALRTLPPDSPSRRAGTDGFDVLGVLLSFSGLLLLLYALNHGEEMGGWASTQFLVVAGSGAALLALFVGHELRTASPLLALESLRNRRLAAGLLAALTGYVLLAGCNFVLPFYLVYVKGLRPEQVGAVMVVYSVVYVALSPFAGRLADRRSARAVSAVGMLLAAAACVWLLATLGPAGLVAPITYLVWRAAAYAAFISPNNTWVMELAASGDQGGVSALLKVAVNLSLVIGLVVAEVLFALPLPESDQSLADQLGQGSVTVDEVGAGVVLAYAFGILVCLLSAGFAVLGGRGPAPARAGG